MGSQLQSTSNAYLSLECQAVTVGSGLALESCPQRKCKSWWLFCRIKGWPAWTALPLLTAGRESASAALVLTCLALTAEAQQ